MVMDDVLVLHSDKEGKNDRGFKQHCRTILHNYDETEVFNVCIYQTMSSYKEPSKCRHYSIMSKTPDMTSHTGTLY